MGKVHKSYLEYALPALLALGAGWGVYYFAAAKLPKLVYWVPGAWLIDAGQVRSGLAVTGSSLLLATIAVVLVFIVVRRLGSRSRRSTSD